MDRQIYVQLAYNGEQKGFQVVISFPLTLPLMSRKHGENAAY